jgi:glutamate-1-semialdehyde 2,1-aminomutase
MVAVGDVDVEVDPDDIPSTRYGGGIPQAVADLTKAVPFNDAAALERRIEGLDSEGRKPACLIMEAAMMNIGVVLPEEGYLEAVRDITKRHGVVLIFDEVKTGLAIAAGGATERFGVEPDLLTLAKTLGGGLPSGAIGGTEEAMSVVEEGTVFQVGTFNGNPLTMAIARTVLADVLTPDAYRDAEALGREMFSAASAALAAHGQPCYGIVHGFKGSVVFHDRAATNYREFLAINTAVSHLHYLVQYNNDVFIAPWAKTESWTLSVMHTSSDAERFVANVDRTGAMLATVRDQHSELFAVGSVT